MDSQISRIANSIHRELSGSPAAPTGYSIFRVPRILRELNQKAYTPQMVSIGPLHHGKQDLIPMEQHKKQYFKDLLGRAPPPPPPPALKLEICVRLVKQSEVRIRNCYSEESNLNSDQFVKMVLMDSAFIIESILKNSTGFSACSAYVQKDMVLIENQLPFFILEEIYNQFVISTRQNRPSFLDLATHYFSNFLLMQETTISSSEVKHFVDLLRMIHLPPSLLTSTPHESETVIEVKETEKYIRVKNVTALHEAGMKFKVASVERKELRFVYEKGVLFLPHFRIQDSTQPALSNIMAMEQYVYPHCSYIIDCVTFMDGLIDTARDVDILVQNDILQNWLGDNLAVANMFNKLAGEVFLTSHKFYFYSLSDDLNKYCEVRRHKWKATLRRDYFSSPWRIASTIAAFILLFLTFVQAVCAVLERYRSP